MSSIEGSKPRKFITRTVLTNPSLYSVSVTSLLNPQSKALPNIYEALEKKKKLILERDLVQAKLFNAIPMAYRVPRQEAALPRDSVLPRESSFRCSPTYLPTSVEALQLAEKEFDRSKLRAERSQLWRGSGVSGQGLIRRNSSVPSLSSFHYTRKIKQKQAKPFNIISNL